MGYVSKHFNREEFACKCGCGFDTVDSKTLEVLEDVRTYFGSPVTVTSACRCLPYNRSIGSTDNSQHPKGRAVDFVVKDVAPEEVQQYLLTKYVGVYGIGKYESFTHIDTRSGLAARW